MAGRKQHYIPQSLLRGFQAARSGTKAQVLVFRKGRPPYLSSTEGVAAERDFYSNPRTDGAGALDDRVTDFESEHLAPMLRELGSADVGLIDREVAAVAVAHLAFRTAHLRSAVSTLATLALNQTQSLFRNVGALRRFVGVDSLSPDSTVTTTVRSELSRLGVNAWPEKDRGAIERIFVFRLREKFDGLVAESTETIIGKLDETGRSLHGMAAKAHARALSASLVPQERLDALQRLDWSVVAIDDNRHAILPDCVVAARCSSDEDLKPFATISAGDAACVVMPISSQRVLVGTNGPVQLDLAWLNQQLAKCSLDFFVASKDDPSTRSLVDLMGGCGSDWNVNLFDQDVTSSPDENPEEEIARKAVLICVPSGKFGNAARRAISRIAAATLDNSTIERIESVTVPANLGLALETVWNRKPTAKELKAAQVGTVEPVKSNGMWKCRVILPRALVGGIVGADPSNCLLATRFVRFNFGRVYYFDCVARHWPAAFDQEASASWHRVAHAIIFRAAGCFFGGLASANHESEPLPGGESLQELAHLLRQGLFGLRQARHLFVLHQSLDRLILEAAASIEFVLVATASVCGFLEAKNMAISEESDAGSVLANACLLEWSRLYGADLRRHHEQRERWRFPEEYDLLIGHIERLLWTIGVVVSDTGSGHWIDVLDDQRLQILARILEA